MDNARNLKSSRLYQGSVKMVRSDRFDNFANTYDLKIQIADQMYDVANISESGLSFKVKSEGAFEEEEYLFKIFVQNKIMHDGSGKIAWARQTDDGNFYGLEFRSGYLPQYLLRALEILDFIQAEVEKNHASFIAIPKDFRNLVYEIKSYLKALKQQLDSLEAKMEVQGQETKDSMRPEAEHHGLSRG